MANAKKCDRCGRLYESYEGVAVTKGGRKYHALSLENDYVYKWYDLCPVCMARLVNFISNSECEQDMEAME